MPTTAQKITPHAMSAAMEDTCKRQAPKITDQIGEESITKEVEKTGVIGRWTMSDKFSTNFERFFNTYQRYNHRYKRGLYQKKWCGREDLKRLLFILKDLQDSGQQAAIIGHFSIQPGKFQEVTKINDVRVLPDSAPSLTNATQNPNRYMTEQEQNRDLANCSPTAILTPELVEIISVWPHVPDSIKTGILAMVRTIPFE